ncbi:MAG: hypothetical protein QXH89_01000, partial [Candidatus Anstonellales archaeon]
KYKGVIILDRASILGVINSIPDRVYDHRGDWDRVELTLWNILQIYKSVKTNIIVYALKEHKAVFKDYDRFGYLSLEAKRLYRLIGAGDMRAIQLYRDIRKGLLLGLADIK